jgi:hypothetical protein
VGKRNSVKEKGTEQGYRTIYYKNTHIYTPTPYESHAYSSGHPFMLTLDRPSCSKHVVYNVAAVSTTPAALNVALFVNRISTLCAHSMYRDQPGQRLVRDLIKLGEVVI